MFEKIFIESEIKDTERTLKITERFPSSEVVIIDSVDNIFGRVKKPYLQKRETLNLFLGIKKGQLVKPAPNAYGLGGEPHFYYVHAYNCIYECDYCYLQGYFHSPDIVIYLNHDEIGDEILRTANELISTTPWFHAGEYSDSLALTHITGEIPFYFELFKKIPHAKLELRTKSINIKEILKETPLPNIITSFSLSPSRRAKENDLKTPSTKARLQAIKSLNDANFKIGIHFDPIIYDDLFIEDYRQLILELNESIPLNKIEYISLGVVRFTKEVYHQVQKNYPNSNLLNQEFIKSFDNKIRYSKPMRMWIMQSVKSMLIDSGMNSDTIYFCMEE
jgi:spore photoproduct lyase